MTIRVSVLLLAILFFAHPISAQDFPESFETMEIDAKFLVPDLRTYERIRNLKDEQFGGYEIAFHSERLFVDQYFDTADHRLFGKDGVLRLRVRYKDAVGQQLRDMRFQAKDATHKVKSVFFRNEVRGPKADGDMTTASYIETQLRLESTDDAVKFARGLIEGPFKSVLEVRDVRVRYFIKKNGVDLFEVSLDRGQMIGLDGNKASAFFYECEVEHVGEKTEETVRSLIDFSESFKARFELVTSPESKYRRAVRAVVDNSLEKTTIFILRHAEKSGDSGDAPLSNDGLLRAQDLKRTLADIKFDEIYATDAKRTQQTAAPLAAANKIDFRLQKLPERLFAAKMRDLRYQGKHVLIVTHYGIVQELIKQLTGEVVNFGNEYDNLFIVTLFPNRKATYVRQRYGRPYVTEDTDN